MGENLPSLSLPGQERTHSYGYETTCALSGTVTSTVGAATAARAQWGGTATPVEFAGPEHPSVDLGSSPSVVVSQSSVSMCARLADKNQPMLGSQ